MTSDSTSPRSNPPALHRDGVNLASAVRDLREALAAGPDRAWTQRVAAALGALAAQVSPPPTVTGGTRDWYHTLVEAQPRLSRAVAAHARDQASLANAVNDLLAHVRRPGALIDANRVRDRAAALVARIERHRQSGSDLLHDVDIGGES